MTSSSKNSDNHPEELQIPVPWGFIAAKWWGPKNIRPVLGLHGWQDNAGTFDRLAPLLPKHMSLLAVDLPGHGLSSPIPSGLAYDKSHFVYIIKYLKNEYKWKKVSILGHSMGAIIGFTYCSLYPDDVDMMIAIDGLKLFYVPPHHASTLIKSSIDGISLETERNMIKSEPPCYTYPELVEKLSAGMKYSMDKEYAHHILRRGVRKSELYPGKYYFIRDGRLKHFGMFTFDYDMCELLAKQITAPYCLIVFSGSSDINREDQSLSKHFVEEMANTLPIIEIHGVEGKHHTHLNEPEKVVEIVTTFIEKYRPDFVANQNKKVQNRTLKHVAKMNIQNKSKL